MDVEGSMTSMKGSDDETIGPALSTNRAQTHPSGRRSSIGLQTVARN